MVDEGGGSDGGTPPAPHPPSRQGGDRRGDNFSQVLAYLQMPEIAHLLVQFKIDILSKDGHREPRRKQRTRGGTRERVSSQHSEDSGDTPWMGHSLQPTTFNLKPK